jgi:hypothetical protein
VQAGGGNLGRGAEIEVFQALQPGQVGFLHAARDRPSLALVDLGGQQAGQEGQR